MTLNFFKNYFILIFEYMLLLIWILIYLYITKLLPTSIMFYSILYQISYIHFYFEIVFLFEYNIDFDSKIKHFIFGCSVFYTNIFYG